MMKKIYLGLGSNLGDRGANVQSALEQLERWGVKVVRSSSLYETEPFGNTDQDWFLNMVAQCETEKSPEDVLFAIAAIEKALKRERKEKWGPRTIDIDILMYGEQVVDKKGLKVPHPGMAERKFVLLPFSEVDGDVVHPVLKKSVRQLLNECTDQSIVNAHK